MAGSKFSSLISFLSSFSSVLPISSFVSLVSTILLSFFSSSKSISSKSLVFVTGSLIPLSSLLFFLHPKENRAINTKDMININLILVLFFTPNIYLLLFKKRHINKMPINSYILLVLIIKLPII